ncbi:MAG: hypothetical protein LC791_15250 [Acidobacteria bacterium]|nr:hypothetical protein [Acidobacteriota bacterium]
MHTNLTASARLAFLLLPLLVEAPAAQRSIDGSWEMTAYESAASVGQASGLLTFASDRFSLVYTMDAPGGQTSGRAHAGKFRLSEDTMTLDVDWTLEYVSGKGQAQRGGNIRRTVKTTMEGDRLTLTFDNGSVQRFHRVR